MSLPWEFHDHFSFVAEACGLEHAESKRLRHQCFNVGDVIFMQLSYDYDVMN